MPADGTEHFDHLDPIMAITHDPHAFALERPLDAERVRTILARVESGFYDSREVRTQVASRLSAELFTVPID
jgi:hypothetical protein